MILILFLYRANLTERFSIQGKLKMSSSR